MNKDDVLKVAKALLEEAPWYESAGSSWCGFAGVMCNHCNATKVSEWVNIEHDPGCPVLIAQDLLVGSDDET